VISRHPLQLRREQQEWDDLASLDPLWAIFSDPEKKGGRWKLEEFLATGEADVRGLLETAQSLGYPHGRARALDFGCGVGRLTRALSPEFDECYGVDVSPRMVRLAQNVNSDRPNCVFLVSASRDLRMFESQTFDLVVSLQVLQHVSSRRAIVRYVEEFLRVTRPGGIIVFQVLTGMRWRDRRQLRARLYGVLRHMGADERFLYLRLGLVPYRMTPVGDSVVQRVVARAGEAILRSEPEAAESRLESRRYFVTRG
jgi:SAM-dependent methyltransferase